MEDEMAEQVLPPNPQPPVTLFITPCSPKTSLFVLDVLLLVDLLLLVFDVLLFELRDVDRHRHGSVLVQERPR